MFSVRTTSPHPELGNGEGAVHAGVRAGPARQDLQGVVRHAVDWHHEKFPPVAIEMLDNTSGRPVRRNVPLLVITTHDTPFRDRTWSDEWIRCRGAARWPEEHGGFHADHEPR